MTSILSCWNGSCEAVALLAARGILSVKLSGTIPLAVHFRDAVGFLSDAAAYPRSSLSPLSDRQRAFLMALLGEWPVQVGCFGLCKGRTGHCGKVGVPTLPNLKAY
jgi:hypothetical protein